MYTYVHKSMTTAAAATKTPTTTTIETITQAAAPIWCWVVPEYARRSTRHTNGRQMKVADVSPRLGRSHVTALRTMVNEWNTLPQEIVALPTLKAFMKAVRSSDTVRKSRNHQRSCKSYTNTTVKTSQSVNSLHPPPPIFCNLLIN
jgi:hypothetical protein